MTSKADWVKLQELWASETYLSFTKFCMVHDVTVSTARRHIDVSTGGRKRKPDVRPRKKHKLKPALPSEPNKKTTKGGQSGNQNARKSGRYSKYVDINMLDYADTIPLEENKALLTLRIMEQSLEVTRLNARLKSCHEVNDVDSVIELNKLIQSSHFYVLKATDTLIRVNAALLSEKKAEAEISRIMEDTKLKSLNAEKIKREGKQEDGKDKLEKDIYKELGYGKE